MGFEVFLKSVFAPGMAALLTVAILAWKTGPVSPLARRAGASAWIAGVFAGWWLSFGLPWPVESSVDWPIWGAVGAWLLAICVPPAEDGQARARTLGLAILLGAGVAGYALPMTEPLVPRFWEKGDWYLVAGVGGLLAGLAAAGSLAAHARFTAARSLPALVAWCGLASGLLMETGSARAAHAAGIGAAAAGAMMLFSWLRPAGSWHRHAGVPLVGLLALLSIQHYGFGDEVVAWPLMVLALPGLLHAAWARFAPQHGAAWRDALTLVLLTALPLAIAWAILLTGAPDDPYGGYGNYGG